MSKTLELVIQEQQSVIGNLHTQLALVKAQATEQIEALKAKIEELENKKEEVKK